MSHVKTLSRPRADHVTANACTGTPGADTVGVMGVRTKAAPECLEERHLLYLDRLSQSRVADMYGAALYLEAEFDLARLEATAVLVHWFRTFATRHPKKSRRRDFAGPAG